MYEIIINDAVVATVVLPCYVYYDTVLASFCTCDYDEAEAVLVYVEELGEQKELYADLVEKPYRHEGFPVATIRKVVA